MSPTSSQLLASLCVECGPNVKVDEDGLCTGCGATCCGQWLDKHWRKLWRALKPRRPSAPKEAREEKRAAKREATRAVRAAVLERARGQCECGCGRPFVLGGPELDHFFGRARAESVQACWALRSDCHHRKTTATPSAEAWFERFRAHCIRYSYWAEAKRAASRLAYVEAKKRLGERLNQFTPRGQHHG